MGVRSANEKAIRDDGRAPGVCGQRVGAGAGDSRQQLFDADYSCWPWARCYRNDFVSTPCWSHPGLFNSPPADRGHFVFSGSNCEHGDGYYRCGTRRDGIFPGARMVHQVCDVSGGSQLSSTIRIFRCFLVDDEQTCGATRPARAPCWQLSIIFHFYPGTFDLDSDGSERTVFSGRFASQRAERQDLRSPLAVCPAKGSFVKDPGMSSCHVLWRCWSAAVLQTSRRLQRKQNLRFGCQRTYLRAGF